MRVPLVEGAVGWTIAVDRIEIFGVPFDNQLITFMDIGANIGIPQPVYRTLIEKDDHFSRLFRLVVLA
ncbi:hypothetical protein M3Y99_00905700 [Aphelenchoides fujianensis]|nr:hypothetical protein M3Y99_00905700 [Aphelenchoides fujianensis]